MATKQEEQNSDLNEMLDDITGPAYESTREFIPIWRDAINYAFDNQLAGKKREQGWDRIQANYIYPVLQQRLALASQRRPKFIAKPNDDADVTGAKFHENLLAWQFENVIDVTMLSMRAMLDAMLFGLCIGKVRWNSRLRWLAKEHRWEGGPDIQLIHPAHFGADPDAETMATAGHICCRRAMPVAQAQAIWPDFTNEIKEAAGIDGADDAWPLDTEGGGGIAPREDQSDSGPSQSKEGQIAQLLDWTKSRQPKVRSDRATGAKQATYVAVEEVYWRDYEEVKKVDVELIRSAELESQGRLVMRDGIPVDPLSGEPFVSGNWPRRNTDEYNEPTYPNGRFVVRLGPKGRQVIVNPEPENQVWAKERWPYRVGVHSLLPHMWRGLDGISMGKGIQDWRNLTMAMMAATVKHAGAPPIIVEEGTVQGAENNEGLARKLKRVPQAIWKVMKGRREGIKAFPFADMPPSVGNFWNLLDREGRDQLGMQDIGIGREGGGDKTATEAQNLLRESHRRSGMGEFFQERWLLDLAKAVAELNQRYLREGDNVRVAPGGGGSLVSPQAMELIASVLDQMGMPQGDVVLSALSQANAASATSVTVPPQAFDVHYDLTLEMGTAVPLDVDQAQKRADLLSLWAAIASIPSVSMALLPNLLRAFDIDDADRIVQAAQAGMAQQQVMDGQGQPAGQQPALPAPGGMPTGG